jgi:hypothetical protein
MATALNAAVMPPVSRYVGVLREPSTRKECRRRSSS